MPDIDSMQFWMDELANRSEGTKEKYKGHFLKFVKWINKSPNELIEIQRRSRRKTEDPRKNRVLESKMKAYLHHLEEEGLAPSTCRLAYASIKSFFSANFFPLQLNSQDRPRGESEGSGIPEKDNIMTLLNGAKSRQSRAVILFLKDSGLRVSDVVRVKWNDLTDFGDGFYGFKILTKKRKIQATAFIGPETSEALKHLDRKNKRIFPTTAKTLSNVICKIMHDTGFSDMTAHGLRKFYNVELQAARVPKEWRYQMMGKKVEAYDEKRTRKLFEAYSNAYNHLQIYGSKVNGRIKALEKENEKLQEQLKDMQQEIANWKKVTMDLHEILKIKKE